MDAHADTDATHMDADDSRVGSARTQQGQGKNRSDKDLHDKSLSRDASSPLSPASAWMVVALYGKLLARHSFKIVQIDTLLDQGMPCLCGPCVQPYQNHQDV